MIFSENASCEAKHFLLVQLHDKLTIFSLQKTHMRMNLDHVASSHFVLTCSLRVQYWPLAVRQARFVHVKVRDTCSCDVDYPQVVTLSPCSTHSSYVPNGDVFGAFLGHREVFCYLPDPIPLLSATETSFFSIPNLRFVL